MPRIKDEENDKAPKEPMNDHHSPIETSTSMNLSPTTRRSFLAFMGRTLALGKTLPHWIGGSIAPLLSGCQNQLVRSTLDTDQVQVRELTPYSNNNYLVSNIPPSIDDQIHLAQGFTYEIVAKWGDPIGKGLFFGSHADYLAFFPNNLSGTEGILWVNHEYMSPLFLSGYQKGQKRTRAQIELEQKAVGGSLVYIRKNSLNGNWEVDPTSSFNRRLDATTKIPFICERDIEGSRYAIGTLANCAGGVTPWGTVLSCEENTDLFYGSKHSDQDGAYWFKSSIYGWEKFFSYPPEHYGWVVEIDPKTGQAKKLTALGRFAHESATTCLANDDRTVVYLGDDSENQCLYKFISSRPGSLHEGKLYVANLESGKWVSLSLEDQPSLREKFIDQTDVLIRTRDAAHMVGGTRLPRPEDIEIDPQTGAVYVALTNQIKNKNYHGSILKLEELNQDPLALEFKSSTFKMGGVENGFACPDNLAFDKKGNLWMTTDVSGKLLNQDPYREFKNNSLFYIPLHGPQAGQTLRVATAPIEAEFTGPCFSPDGKTLFLSVQHPGEETKDIRYPTSHWPDGPGSIPKSAVIAISLPPELTLD